MKAVKTDTSTYMALACTRTEIATSPKVAIRCVFDLRHTWLSWRPPVNKATPRRLAKGTRVIDYVLCR